jgi:Na+/H+ antiporter NhaD/arsenite permease-like protein
MVSHPTRVLALALCLGVVLGGSLPELGNLATYYILHWPEKARHYFNGYFTLVGVLGIIIFGLTLFRRLLQSIWNKRVG